MIHTVQSSPVKSHSIRYCGEGEVSAGGTCWAERHGQLAQQCSSYPYRGMHAWEGLDYLPCGDVNQ